MSGTRWALRAVQEIRSSWPNGFITASLSTEYGWCALRSTSQLIHNLLRRWLTSQATSGHCRQDFGIRSGRLARRTLAKGSASHLSLFPDSFEKLEVGIPQVIRDRKSYPLQESRRGDYGQGIHGIDKAVDIIGGEALPPWYSPGPISTSLLPLGGQRLYCVTA
ncbi:hypothetical protein BDP81DRAFT_413050 [Colletotrichum phormii]|uniref:Uncharacterized protein n=1 Tax=Colletotrichum phormii TaxID=359342 RepID=A0AAJ0A6V4_9PEZI|nr:uncharacterized protein BDP81DRAFT_413050 [Colletotrichum phormii]KAK1655630.1 hypothetical protein BDP81DRAFT_413050 [Colletotrichum phormii]